MTISAAVIIAYLGFFTLFGIFLNRNNKSSADWATGGAGMGIWMLAAGIAGTRIGGAGTYGGSPAMLWSPAWATSGMGSIHC